MSELTPRQIVDELDKYVIGQKDAKRAVAVAIRNRWRRQQLDVKLREEVLPKNIIMIGPTGVGKTEIARRLANLVGAPFLKVEASKYTEIGYHGRDVESIIRDLVEIAINMERSKALKTVEEKAKQLAEERLLDVLIPQKPGQKQDSETQELGKRTRELMRKKLHEGKLDDNLIELKVEEKAVPLQILSNVGMDQMDFEFQNMFEKLMPTKSADKKVPVKEARMILFHQEIEKLIDKEKITKDAIENAQDSGIVFVDELDKIAGKESMHGPDVSRQGVQRDLLPIVEGSSVPTRHGIVRTDHILFIAAGAFHMTKPSDLIPELQGRFPIRVELASLNKDDFVRILTEPENALVKQYEALLSTEGIKLVFKKDAIEEIARIAEEVNTSTQNIGARRLHTIMEKMLEDVSFEAPDITLKSIPIDRDYVRKKLENIVKDEDLSRYIL